MLGTAAPEAPEELLGFGGAQLERGAVPDALVVVLGEQLPIDPAG